MSWKITDLYVDDEKLKKLFGSIDDVFKLEGEQITHSPISELIKIEVGSKSYYVKRYMQAGKYLRKFLGRSRLQAEWENLFFFQSLGIPTAKVVAYGQQYQWGIFNKGALITEGMENVYDLEFLSFENSSYLKNPIWLSELIKNIADYTRRLHDHKFVHNDLKWRNILVRKSDKMSIFFIDCPAGERKSGFLLNRGKIKDLACLDKVAKYQLNRKQRLKFYMSYRKIDHLTETDKTNIKKILGFFSGRE